MNRIVIVAAALLLLTNLVVLSGVAYNRSGGPASTIELTERELRLPGPWAIADENSGTSLQVQWQTLYRRDSMEYSSSYQQSPAWLDDAKLTALGFDLRTLKAEGIDSNYWELAGRKDVILVLEYDGVAYQTALQRLEEEVARTSEKARRYPDNNEYSRLASYKTGQLAQLKVSDSRLFVIDAGLDLATLRQKYPDNGRYLLWRGEIGAYPDEHRVAGHIDRLSIESIHVPLPWSRQLSQFAQRDSDQGKSSESRPPRYTVQLHTGKRLEPWVGSVASAAQPPHRVAF